MTATKALIRSLILTCMIILCIVPAFGAVGDGELELTSVRIFTDGQRESSADETGGDIDNDVLPGSTIKMRFTLENLFDQDDDIDIEEITIEGTLIDVDLGADIDDETSEFSIEAGESKETSLSFTIPDLVDPDTYRLEVVISGEADNNEGTEYEFDVDYLVRVTKLEHDVRINRAALQDTRVQCGGQTTLAVEVQNYGLTEENLARLKVDSDALAVNYASTFTLGRKLDDENNIYNRQYTIQVPFDTEPGTYEVRTRSFYLKTIHTDTEISSLTVECDPEAPAEEPAEEVEEPAQQPPQEEKPAEKEENTDSSTTTQTTQDTQQDDGAATITLGQEQSAQTQPKETHESKSSGDEESSSGILKWVILIMLMNVLIIGVGTAVLVLSNKKHKKNEFSGGHSHQQGNDKKPPMTYY